MLGLVLGSMYFTGAREKHLVRQKSVYLEWPSLELPMI